MTATQVTVSQDFKTDAGILKQTAIFTGTSLTLDSTYYLIEFTPSTGGADVVVTLPPLASN